MERSFFLLRIRILICILVLIFFSGSVQLLFESLIAQFRFKVLFVKFTAQLQYLGTAKCAINVAFLLHLAVNCDYHHPGIYGAFMIQQHELDQLRSCVRWAAPENNWLLDLPKLVKFMA